MHKFWEDSKVLVSDNIGNTVRPIIKAHASTCGRTLGMSRYHVR